MRDEELRRLERAAREGDRQAAQAFFNEQYRNGSLVRPWWDVPEHQEVFHLETGLPLVQVGKFSGMRYVLVPPGAFVMGSPASEGERFEDERQHGVVIERPFYLAATTVTNALYRKFRPEHSSGDYENEDLAGDEQPVVRVSWHDAQAFCTWLGERDGFAKTRLPQEAEWAYACRAGTTTSRWWGDDEAGAQGRAKVADEDTRERWPHWNVFVGVRSGYRVTAPVGSFLPNPWGLLDMLGNVWEWCQDVYREYPEEGRVPSEQEASEMNYRCLRGGSWDFASRYVRAAARGWDDPGLFDDCFGFRVVGVESV